MADFSYIIAEINTNLPDNNQQRITAHALRQTMVDLTYTIAQEQNDWELQASYILDDVEHALDNIIVDNLTSSYTDRALSANQGKELNLRLTDVEDKTKYILYADSDYTNMRGTLDISGSIEADSAIIDVLASDSIELAGEDLDTTLTGITNKISPLSTGIYDNRSYMRIMTDDVEVMNLSVADTTVTDYLEVLGNEMTLGNIVMNAYNGYWKTDAIYAYSYLVVGTHNVGNELETLNTKMVKCTQQQYDTWSALGQIDSNKYYFIIEDSSSSLTASTTSLDTSSITLTKSASLSTVSVDESIIDTNIEQEDDVETTDVVETEDETKTDEVEER